VGNGRYEAAVATFIGLLALIVSAYTAWVQRQQVRAQVMPILQYGTSNAPHLYLSVDNKGVGPALIKHVVVTVDDEAMPLWPDVMQKLLGPGRHPYSESDIGSLILSAGESVHIFTPLDEKTAEPLQPGEPPKPGQPPSIGQRFNEGRMHIAVEICYCSTLGDCWLLKSGPRSGETRDQVSRCPAKSARTFQQ
jgi:hypothetical protein